MNRYRRLIDQLWTAAARCYQHLAADLICGPRGEPGPPGADAAVTYDPAVMKLEQVAQDCDRLAVLLDDIASLVQWLHPERPVNPFLRPGSDGCDEETYRRLAPLRATWPCRSGWNPILGRLVELINEREKGKQHEDLSGQQLA